MYFLVFNGSNSTGLLGSKSLIDATPNTVFHEIDKNRRQTSFRSHTYTLSQEIKSPVQMVDFELMTYT